MDILNILYPLYKYQVMILFDHSCGNYCQRLDGLNINAMNKEYVNGQIVIHDMLLTKIFIGTFNLILKSI